MFYRILCKLDRILGNLEWMQRFPDASVKFLPAGLSDHSPAILSMQSANILPKPFRFFHVWMKYQAFEATVSTSWDSACFVETILQCGQPVE